MLDYRVDHAVRRQRHLTDEEHAATLNNFLLFFGDVMTTDEAIGRLRAGDAAQDRVRRSAHRRRITAASSHEIARYISDDTIARMVIAVITMFILKIWLPYWMR